jgi:regulator of sigma D
MTKKSEATHHPRTKTRHLIEGMLEERKRMLVLLWELAKLDLHHIDDQTKEMLEDFLEILVDYIAAGHFGLYQRIVEGNERRTSVLKTAAEIYEQIQDSTDLAVEFSERYESADTETLNRRLAGDLSKLAERITTRIELEDQLILAMLGQDYAIPSVA